MNELDALENILDEVENVGYNSETRYGLQDYDPETVVINDWNSNRQIRANTTSHGGETDDLGNTIGEQHHYYYTMEVTIESKSPDELTATEMFTDIKNHFRKFEGNPRRFHEDTVLFKMGGGGVREPNFDVQELRVFKVYQTFRFEIFDKEVRTDEVEPIEEIETDYDIE